MTLKEAIKHCKDVALSCTNKECALEHFQLLKWLQEYSNMLEKQGEQKPVWNEEDENRINRLIAYFEDKESFTSEDDIVYANWLQSLRPQEQWKPSDEQMEALKGVQEGVFRLGILESLYNDLKKLKREEV